MVSTENAFRRLCKSIERRLPTLNAPGIAIGITHREYVLHAEFFGLANKEAGQPVTPETLFQIGSISKSFTSIVLLQLQEQGLLDINDPVTKYLPWFEIQSEYAPITLQHLMSHTAGIITGSDDTPAANTEAWNLRYTKAAAPPGEMFHYSNSGYKVLGLVLETLLGQDISTILRERIFVSLEMNASLPDIRNKDRQQLATGYTPLYDDRPLPPGGILAPATWFESNTADGAICSNAEDMCRYLQMLMQRGHGLLTPESFEQLTRPVIATGDGLHGEHYGLGLFTMQMDGHHVIGHSGGMVGYTADFLADLDSGLGVIVLTNGPAEPSKISHYALSLFRAALDGNDLPNFPEEKLDNVDDYVGTYWCGNKSLTLTADNKRLSLDFESATVPLHLLAPDSFIVPHPAFEMFALCMERENEQVTGAGWGAERYVREGIQEKAPFESPEEWDAYPGHYRSHNPWLNNFRVVLRAGSLVFIHPSGEEESLHQLETGLFRIGNEPLSPEFIRFDVVVNGKSMQAICSGGVYSRTFTP
ncbi:MAG TPA: serine hydrolase domain-containing protein [Anaerolineales bacterium]|nr:serine hydrolase domain-containing protein [Anaerolineales bacterium]